MDKTVAQRLLQDLAALKVNAIVVNKNSQIPLGNLAVVNISKVLADNLLTGYQ